MIYFVNLLNAGCNDVFHIVVVARSEEEAISFFPHKFYRNSEGRKTCPVPVKLEVTLWGKAEENLSGILLEGGY